MCLVVNNIPFMALGLAGEPGTGYFVELFAGAGGLTAAVRRRGLLARRAVDILNGGIDIECEDLRDRATFSAFLKEAKSGRV